MKLTNPLFLLVPVVLFIFSNNLGLKAAGPVVGLTLGIGYAGYLLFERKRYDLMFPIIGGAMDMVALVSNGGRMPVLNPPNNGLDAAHVLLTSSTHFKVLCDTCPLGNFAVISIGDVLILLAWPIAGLLIFLMKRDRALTER
jgi:hypothetical protein